MTFIRDITTNSVVNYQQNFPDTCDDIRNAVTS